MLGLIAGTAKLTVLNISGSENKNYARAGLVMSVLQLATEINIYFLSVISKHAHSTLVIFRVRDLFELYCQRIIHVDQAP